MQIKTLKKVSEYEVFLIVITFVCMSKLKAWNEVCAGGCMLYKALLIHFIFWRHNLNICPS